MTLRIITNKARVHVMSSGTDLLVGRRYCYEGRRFGRLFFGSPKIWGPMPDVISTHAELVAARGR